MNGDYISRAKGEFGALLANRIREQDDTMVQASRKLGLHSYVISRHIRMVVRPRIDSIRIYSKYLQIDPSSLANMIDNDWRNLN